MKFQLYSDLHLEFDGTRHYHIPEPGQVDTLILAGDICNLEYLKRTDASPKRTHILKDFKFFCDLYKHVIFVPGNHEFYSSGHVDQCDRYFDLLRNLVGCDNLYPLQNQSIVLDDIAIFGSTFWTDFNKGEPLAMFDAGNGMNDYRAAVYQNRALRPRDTLAENIKARAALSSFTQEFAGKKQLVVTHHLPSVLCVPDRFRGNPLNAAFHNFNLESFIQDSLDIKVWCHGHTHDSVDLMLGNTRILANPHGYPLFDGRPENPNYKPEFTFEL